MKIGSMQMDRAEDRNQPDEEIIQTYIRYGREKNEEDFWAWELYDTLVAYEPERAWPMLLRMIDIAPDELVGYIGAGPMEDMVKRHGARFVGRMEENASRDERFRTVLSHVWFTRGRVPPEVEARLVRATEGRILVFPDHDEGANGGG